MLRIFFKETDKTHLQFVRYIVLGNISNIVDFACLYILTEFAGFHYTISNVISYILGVSSNYIINIKWIFKRGNHAIHTEFMLVIIISSIGLLLSIIIIHTLVEYVNIHYMPAKFISAIIIMFWNFYSRKKWVFK
jgi:putative flippase GtrA